MCCNQRDLCTMIAFYDRCYRRQIYVLQSQRYTIIGRKLAKIAEISEHYIAPQICFCMKHPLLPKPITYCEFKQCNLNIPTMKLWPPFLSNFQNDKFRLASADVLETQSRHKKNFFLKVSRKKILQSEQCLCRGLLRNEKYRSTIFSLFDKNVWSCLLYDKPMYGCTIKGNFMNLRFAGHIFIQEWIIKKWEKKLHNWQLGTKQFIRTELKI
jgi:hypothetical protein